MNRSCALFVWSSYPAATLIAYKIDVPGYKPKEAREPRKQLLHILSAHIGLPMITSLMEVNADALDAAICVLAGADFLNGEVFNPPDLEIARQEGWIWVRRPRP